MVQTRSSQSFPITRKRERNQKEFLLRRRSPRSHQATRAYDRQADSSFRQQRRQRQRKARSNGTDRHREKEGEQARDEKAEVLLSRRLPSDHRADIGQKQHVVSPKNKQRNKTPKEISQEGNKVPGPGKRTEEVRSDAVTSPRRSSRNIHAIRLRGTAGTFYRHLRTLFFSRESSDKGYQSIGGNRMRWQRMHVGPPIYVIEDFLTTAELEYFDSCVKDLKFQRSFVDNVALDEMKGADDDEDDPANDSLTNGPKKRQRRILFDTTHRTSRFFGFKKLQDCKIASLERRVAELLGCWVHQIEPLQLVRYLPGEFFNVHHDTGDLMDNDEVKLPKRHVAVKRRVLTLFFYLNTLSEDQGGCTYFPKCNLRVRPKRGSVVIWSNLTEDGLPDPRTIHAGEPVKSPEKDFAKYGLNLWICEE